MKNKVSLFFFFSFLAVISMPLTVSANETITDVEETLKELETEKKETENEIKDLKKEVEDLKKEIKTIDKTIEDNEKRIKELEVEIPEMKENSKDMLVFLQQTNPGVSLISLISEDEDDEGLNSVQTVYDLNLLTEGAVKAVEEMGKLQVELESSQEELAHQQKEAEKKQKEIDKKVAEAENEKEQVINDIETQEKYLELFVEADCKPNEVFGVDCGVGSAVIVSNGEFKRPISEGYVTAEMGTYSPFGVVETHNGTDFDGDPAIYAVADGTVVTTAYGSSGYGNHVVIIHNVDGQPVYTLYGHLSSISVSPGQSVKDTTQIGVMGSTGYSTGTHLHLEVREGSNFSTAQRVNSRKYIDLPDTMEHFEGR